MSWFLGLDSSTQSLSAVIIDLAGGTVVHEDSVNFGRDLPEFACAHGFLEHPDPLVKHSDPRLWAAALDLLLRTMRRKGVGLERVAGIGGSGQQHGTVYLNERFLTPAAWAWNDGLAAMLEPMLSRGTAPIWMDSSTGAECREISEAAGGADAVRRCTGSAVIERFSGPQIRRFHKLDPGGYERTAAIHLVSSFMCSLLIGHSAPVDWGDGAGMNLLNLETGAWDPAMLQATAPDLAARLPALRPSTALAGTIAPYFVERYGFRAGTPVNVWSGDNPNSLIGVGGWRPGVAVVSLGTSTTYFAAMAEPAVDPNGFGHVFGNPAGGFMSLICFKNGALAQERVRDMHSLDWPGFDRLLRTTPAGNNGNLAVPFFVPEITPLVLEPRHARRGSATFEAGRDAAADVRAVVEAQAMSLRLFSGWIAPRPSVLRVTGGASVSTEICQVLADVFDSRVERLQTGNSAGLGAALRAAQAVAGIDWGTLGERFCGAVPGRDVYPVPAHVQVYEKLLPLFAALVNEQRM